MNAFDHEPEIADTSFDIPGDLFTADLPKLRHKLASILGRERESDRFFGSQPISLKREHVLKDLKNEDYLVCEKSDGLRCLLFICDRKDGQQCVFLITRKNEFYLVPRMEFPLPPTQENLGLGTVLDGELVKEGDSLRYLSFDCLAWAGQNCTQRDLNTRIRHILIYYSFYKKFRDDKIRNEMARDSSSSSESFSYANAPFSLSVKGMTNSYNFLDVCKAIEKKTIKHVSDGLIFTAVNSPYRPGTDEHILKWKPPHLNTIDFQLSIEFGMAADREDVDDEYVDYDSKPIFHLLIWLGQYNNQDTGLLLNVTNEEWEHMKSLEEPMQDRIVECFKDRDGNWRYLRFRDDKETANHISTYQKVLESIHDGVTITELASHQQEMKRNWKEKRHLIAPSVHQQHQQYQHPHQQYAPPPYLVARPPSGGEVREYHSSRIPLHIKQYAAGINTDMQPTERPRDLEPPYKRQRPEKRRKEETDT